MKVGKGKKLRILKGMCGYVLMGVMSVILYQFFISPPQDPIISDREDLADLMERPIKYSNRAHMLSEERKLVDFVGKLSGSYSRSAEMIGNENYIAASLTLNFDDKYKKLYSSLDIAWKDGTEDRYEGESLYSIEGSHVSLRILSGSKHFAPVNGISFHYVDESELMVIEPDGKSGDRFNEYLFVKNKEKG